MGEAATSALIVEDSETQRQFLTKLLASQDFSVSEAATGSEAKTLLSADRFDFVILDLGLPDLDGKDLCTQIKETTDSLVVIVSARSEPMERIVGLGAGADDYIVKPFEPLELLLRLKALARRTSDLDLDVQVEFSIGELELDTTKRTATLREAELKLTKIEFDILTLLCRNVEEVVSRPQLAEWVWGSAEWLGDGHALNVHVANLKKKLAGTDSFAVVAVRGVGYKLVAS